MRRFCYCPLFRPFRGKKKLGSPRLTSPPRRSGLLIDCYKDPCGFSGEDCAVPPRAKRHRATTAVESGPQQALIEKNGMPKLLDTAPAPDGGGQGNQTMAWNDSIPVDAQSGEWALELSAERPVTRTSGP